MAVTVAVPSMESMPFTVAVEAAAIVLTPLPVKVKLLNVVAPVIVCAAPPKITVAVPGEKVPLFNQLPLTVKFTGFAGSMVSEAPD